MKRLLLAGLLFIAGCSYKPTPISVYGRSGAVYSAPDLCAALTKCMNSSETSCFYNTETIVGLDGRSEISACREVKR
ncbi:MAG TPA: hypothetical protein VHX37_13455 [Acidobacteriaceae bacterium]|jgi:hypothetical protein|nr:hypothetical protein [Acidobacteriaceae bacterium]